MAKASKEIVQKHEQMFYPTVRVRTKKAGGSGTVVYSDGQYVYFVVNRIDTKEQYPIVIVFENGSHWTNKGSKWLDTNKPNQIYDEKSLKNYLQDGKKIEQLDY